MAYWLEASVYSIGQDKVNNYTNVRVDLWFCRDSGSAWSGYTTYGYITVDGQRQDFSVGSYGTEGRKHIATKDYRVYHNSDGTKNVAYYCYFNADNAPYVAGLETSGTTGLPTIPRAAGINAVNWSNIESAFNVTYSSPSSSFNYKLRVSIPNVKAIVTYSSYGSGTNKSFTQAEKNSIYKHMVDKGLSSVSLGFVIETYNGTTKIGESSEPTRTVTRAGISSISTNANSYTTGNAIAITIGRNNSVYTHKLYHKLNGVNLSTTTPTTSESYTGMTAATFGAKYPNGTSGTLQLVLDTYYNSIYLGTTSKTVTINLQSYSLPTPTLSLALVNSNATVSGWGIYLKGYSQYKATVGGASGVYSSSVSRYIINGAEQTSNVKTSGVINSSGNFTVSANYKDSRGKNSASAVSKSVTVHDYYVPVISSLTASRYKGTAVHEEGTQITIKCAFSCASCNSKNAVSATAYIRADTTSTWTTLGAISNNVNKVFTTVTLNINTVYIVRVVAKDSLGKEGAREITVTTASASIDVLKGGNGVAIGKMASVANLFDIGWNTKINGNLEVTGAIRMNNSSRFNTSYKTAYRTQVNFGSTSGAFVNPIRTDTANVSQAPQHGAGLAWGISDTHGYLMTNYGSSEAFIGGGNANKLNWVSKVITDNNLKSYILSYAYPVGAVYITYTNKNPGTFLGGTWALFGQDRYIRGAGSSFAGGATGGSGTSGATTLTTSQMPSMEGSFAGHGSENGGTFWQPTGVFGSSLTDANKYRPNLEHLSGASSIRTVKFKVGGGTSHSHSVTPQYLAIYFWRRTA